MSQTLLAPSSRARRGLSLTPIPTLQIGMGWFPEQPGGLNRYFYEAFKYLPGAGVPMQGMVAGSEQAAQESHGRVVSFAPAKDSFLSRWSGARRVFARMSQENPAALTVSHFAPYTFPLLGQLAKKTPTRSAGDSPFVVHFHGPWALEGVVEGSSSTKTWLKKYFERSVYRRATRVVTLSRAFAEIIEREYGYPAERVRVVPGGVEAHRFASGGEGASSLAEAREKLGWPEGRPVVLAVRRLVRRMGLEELIAAATLVRQQVPDALFVLIGKGKLATELAERIAEAGLDSYVRLQGYVPDDLLPWAYRAATLSVVPSSALEGFGLIVAESLAAGTPVLVSRVGGLPEVVTGLSPNLVLPAADPQTLARVISEAVRGTLELPDAEACRQFALTNYDWPVIATKLREVYADALA